MSIAPNNYTCPEELIGIARDVETRLKNMVLNESDELDKLKGLKNLLHEHLRPHKCIVAERAQCMKTHVDNLFNKELTIDNKIKIMECIFLMDVFQLYAYNYRRPTAAKMCEYYKLAKEKHEKNAKNMPIADVISVATLIGTNEHPELSNAVATHVKQIELPISIARRIGGKKTKRRRNRNAKRRRQTRK